MSDLIVSAGLVIIQNNKILLVHPTGSKWIGTYSIPKGHVEEKEDFLETAIRETNEELGLSLTLEDLYLMNQGKIDYKDQEGKDQVGFMKPSPIEQLSRGIAMSAGLQTISQQLAND